MRWRGLSILLVLCMVGVFASQAAFGQGGAKLNVVANDANYGACANWVKFLEEKGISVRHVAPREFSKVKGEKYIVIMGGSKDPDEMGKIVLQALTPEEAKSAEGAARMISKSDLWAKSQNVIFFVGANSQAVEEARRSSRESWWPKIAGWFDVEVESQKAGGY